MAYPSQIPDSHKVFEDVGSYVETMDSAASDKRFKALIEQLDARLTKKYSLSLYDFTDDSLNKSAEVRCKSGLAMYEEAMTLDENSRAFVLRKIFTP